MSRTPDRAGESPDEVSFRNFRVDLSTRELYRAGHRVGLRDQPFEVLACLIESPGQLVSRDELKQRIWGNDTFVDFDRSLNNAVTRLRDALGDSARQPIYIETVTGRGYRFIYPLTESAPTPKPPPATPSVPRWVVVALAAVAAIVVAAAIIVPSSAPPKSITRTPRQLTTDSGWSAWPDISQDGRRVVFSSDRDGGPDLDIWLLDIATGATTQLTNTRGDEIQPRFSADASRVAYFGTAGRATYMVAISGGSPRLIAGEALYPRFSWDGKYLTMTKQHPKRGYSSNLVLANADGSSQRIIGENMRFLGAGLAWTSSHQMLAGGSAEWNWRAGDWFLIDPQQLDLYGTTAGDTLDGGGFDYSRPPPLGPLAWLEPEQAGVFSARQGDSIDLWSLPIDPSTGRAYGQPSRLTSGGDLNFDVGTSPNGAIVYSSTQQNIDIWRLPLDPTTRGAAGPPERLTRGVGAEYRPVVARDGRSMAYLASTSARNLREASLHYSALPSFKPRQLIDAKANYLDMAMGPGGEQIILSRGDPDQISTHTLSVRDSALFEVCAGCGRIHSWSSDQRYLVHGGSRQSSQIVVRDSHTGNDHVLAEHDTYLLGNAQFSADGKWISFGAIVRGMVARALFVMPFDLNKPRREADWIALTGSDGFSFHQQWSPDGERIYYFSDHAGPIAIWAQRVDPADKRPRGEPILVYQAEAGQPKFHSDQLTGLGLPTLAVGEDFLLFDSANTRGNIWLLEPDVATK